MNGLPKIFSYLAIAASAYCSATGKPLPEWFNTALIVISALTHGVLGQGNMVTPSTTVNPAK